jgi:hypothetical protein
MLGFSEKNNATKRDALLSVSRLLSVKEKVSAAIALDGARLVYNRQIGDYYSSTSALNVWIVANHA